MYLLNFAEFLEFDMRIGYIERQVPSAVINIYINFHASVYTISSVEHLCFSKQVFLKISQYSQGNACVGCHDIITQNTTLRLFLPPSQYVTQEGGGSRRRKQRKVTQKGECAVKKVISLIQILLCTFFCDSIFVCSWFLKKP